MTQHVDETEFDQVSTTAAWERLLTAYAGAAAGADLTTHWVELIGTATGASAEQIEEQVGGYAPIPTGPRAVDDVVVEVMNGVSDIAVRICADVVLYDDDRDAAELVAEARRLNDRYCDLFDLVVERHPDIQFDGAGAEPDQEEVPVTDTPKVGSQESPAPWLHRTGTPVDSGALGGLVKRLVSSYSEQADAVTLEAMWRSAFGAASGCDAVAIQEVCETARLPESATSELRAANEVAAGFEELFAAAVVRLFAPDGTGDGDLADEARRLVQRRDALFDLMEELYPGLYDAE